MPARQESEALTVAIDTDEEKKVAKLVPPRPEKY